MRYLVAIPIPDPALSTLIDLKQRFRPFGWRDTMDPHITLLAPDKPLLPFDTAVTAFTDAALPVEQFQLQAFRTERFSRRHHHTLVLRLEPEGPVTCLFSALIDTANWQEVGTSNRRPFVPHITLANQLPDAETTAAENQLAKLNLNLQFDCAEIALYAKQANWPRWRELARRQLSTRKVTS